jgi:hypothetical protein
MSSQFWNDAILNKVRELQLRLMLHARSPYEQSGAAK